MSKQASFKTHDAWLRDLIQTALMEIYYGKTHIVIDIYDEDDADILQFSLATMDIDSSVEIYIKLNNIH